MGGEARRVGGLCSRPKADFDNAQISILQWESLQFAPQTQTSSCGLITPLLTYFSRFKGVAFRNVLKWIDLEVVRASFVVLVIHVRKIFSQKKQVHENIFFTTINCGFHISLERRGGEEKKRKKKTCK